MQSIKSVTLAGVFIAFGWIAQAKTMTYNWTGICGDYTGTATGQLTVEGPTPPAFSYSSNWLVYTMQVVDFQTNGNFPTNPTTFPGGALSFTHIRVDFGSDFADGANEWNTAVTGVGSADLGVSSTFTVAPSGVPEPASVFLFGEALAGLGLARRWYSKRG